MTNDIEHSGVVALGDGGAGAVTLDMKLAAVKAYVGIAGKCRPAAMQSALEAALSARPAQEPVAYRAADPDGDGYIYLDRDKTVDVYRKAGVQFTPVYAAPQPLHTTNCCKCGRIIDTREKKDGGDDFGAQLSDGRWTCSIECDDAVINPTHSQVAGTPDLLTEPAPSGQPPIGWVTVRVEDTGDGLIINPDDALKWRLRDDQAYEGHFLPDGTYRVAIPANAVSPAPADHVMVPQSAIDWLLGEGPDAAGSHFGDDIPERAPRYWWRSHFRELIAAPQPNVLAPVDAKERKECQ